MTEETKEPSKGGRPTGYKEEYNDQALKLARLGATDKELADFFSVDERTINRWKEAHPQFCQSLKEGKLMSDARVSEALYTKAIGYEHNERHYPPDTTACIFWLKNRQPEKWRDKTDIAVDTTSVADALKQLADELPD